MGVEVKIELDEALRQQVEAVTGENSGYADFNAYVRDLIEIDMDRRRWEADLVKAELQAAFAEPEENYRYVTAEEVIARNKLRD